ncbi:MAG: hypothetical protein M1840_004287 [Geoglossum simile]|nr:MAG: hypothetical protein M1840_004287 [Geoglossum simile]
MASPKRAIRIGDVHYDIEVSKIPYLLSFANFQANSQPQSTELVHGPIPLFNVVLKGIESGYRQCFRSMPPDLAQHRTLCETYEFLQVDILGGQAITEIFNDLKSGKTDYTPEDKYSRPVRGRKSEARDTAFKLVYLILLGEFKDENKDSTKVFNAVLFVVSHSGIFKWRTRTVVRAAYEERFVVSPKQRARLDQWKKESDADRTVDNDGDVTTEKEESDYYDSDDWVWD